MFVPPVAKSGGLLSLNEVIEPMVDLVVRRLLVDMNAPFPGRWNGGDAFRSALFNALSMSFPVGEQFFIDSVRAGLKNLPEVERARWAEETQGFIGQEATHRRLHQLFNNNLERLGYRNVLEQRARARIEKNAHVDFRVNLGATAATEHFTAILAEWLLRHPEVFEGSEDRLRTLWLWHAAEESEHRTTAFDLYHACGGNHGWRLRLFNYVTVTFLADITRQTLRNLWHDGSLFRLGTWVGAARLLFGRDGVVRGNYKRWREYKHADFHPSHLPDALARNWLRENTDQFSVVGR